MVQIVVAPERLEAVAQLFADKRAETEGIVSTLRATLEALSAEWEGVAQNRFYSQWNEMLPRMARFAELMGEIGGELQRVAQVFRETDTSVI
jgi:WXG100 family type VII secretion target